MSMLQDEYLLVEVSALPEVFPKVVEAKRLLKRGKVKSLAQAARSVGISRSALYKYKDSVFAYREDPSSRILSLAVSVEDEPGVLSAVIGALYEMHCNIVTINQNIPVDSVALLSISVRVYHNRDQDAKMLERLRSLPKVIEVKNIGAA